MYSEILEYLIVYSPLRRTSRLGTNVKNVETFKPCDLLLQKDNYEKAIVNVENSVS